MLQIKVFGTTPACANCKRAEKQAQLAAEQFKGRVEVVKLDALDPAADAYGVMVTPTMVIGDEVVATGRVVPAGELVALIQAKLGG